jgi:hypothetical protein
VALLACGHAPPQPAAPVRPYACTLHPLAELRPEFSVRQHVEASSGGKGGGFDTVLQKKGDTLVLVGLVAGERAFVLKQQGDQVSFEQSFGPPLPFPPEYVIIDIHRAYWKHLPAGTTSGDLDGEHVEETWSNGNLVERRFFRPGEYKGAVRVEYGSGCNATRCLPASLKITNEWFGYTVTVTNEEFTIL